MTQPAVELRFQNVHAHCECPQATARGYLTIATAVQHGLEVCIRCYMTIVVAHLRQQPFRPSTLRSVQVITSVTRIR